MKKGIELYKILLPHVGEKYVFGTLVPKNEANWHGPWDCAEAVIWGYYQITGKLYGCAKNTGDPATADAYTGFLDRDAEKIGKKITVDEAARIPGAIVLRSPGPGLIGHAVVSNGSGGTIEAHSTATGFLIGKLSGRRWDYGILPPGIEYSELAAVEITPPATKIYRYIAGDLMKESKVGEIQRKLSAWGFYKMKVDDTFGRGTFEAVRGFQSAHGLNTDGEVGPKTAEALGVKI